MDSKVSEAEIERYKRVFLAGHWEGWTGNQQRRDAQHVDAEKGWALYVQNGALEALSRRAAGDDVERWKRNALAVAELRDRLAEDRERLLDDVGRLREALRLARSYIVPGRNGSEVCEIIDAALTSTSTVAVEGDEVERVAVALEREFPECADEGRMGFIQRLARAAIDALTGKGGGK